MYRLPFLNYSGGSNVGYMEIDNQDLSIHTNAGNVVYYYIFLDRIV
ncbi:hypothetical protein THIOSC15_1840007 [uncultured Thiomicrorhabdus sp.]